MQEFDQRHRSSMPPRAKVQPPIPELTERRAPKVGAGAIPPDEALPGFERAHGGVRAFAHEHRRREVQNVDLEVWGMWGVWEVGCKLAEFLSLPGFDECREESHSVGAGFFLQRRIGGVVDEVSEERNVVDGISRGHIRPSRR